MKIADFFASLRLIPDAKSFGSADNLLSGVRNALIGIVSIGSVYWAKNQIQQISDLGDKLDEMAQKTGVPVETLQEMGYAASFSGVSLDSMGTSLGKLAKTMSSAKKGGGEAAKTFRKMGVEFKNADGSLRPMEDVFMDVADHISSMPDGAEKSALSMDVFGRAGKELIPVLNEGGEGLQKLREEAVELGLVMSAEDAEAMAGFNDDMDRLKHSWQGVKILLAKELVPVLGKLVKGLAEWVKTNRKLLAQRMAVVLKLVAKSVALLAKGFMFMLGVIDDLMKAWDGMKYVLGTLAAMFLAVKLASVGAAIASTIAWVISLWPIALATVAVAALLLIVQDLWVAYKKGPSIMEMLYNAAVEWLGEKKFGRILLDVIDAWWKAWKLMTSYWLDELKKVYDYVKDLIGMISDAIGGVKKIYKGDFKGGAKQIGGGVVKRGSTLSAKVIKNSIAGKTLDALDGGDSRSIQDQWLGGASGKFLPTLGPILNKAANPSQFNATFNIQSASGDPTQISQEVSRTLDNWWMGKINEMDPGEDDSP